MVTMSWTEYKMKYIFQKMGCQKGAGCEERR